MEPHVIMDLFSSMTAITASTQKLMRLQSQQAPQQLQNHSPQAGISVRSAKITAESTDLVKSLRGSHHYPSAYYTKLIGQTTPEFYYK